ncbi:MAG: hypothetical protein R6V83_00755 [Candidatus Thorarchaeota archaeon]
MQQPIVHLVRVDLLLETISGIIALAVSHYANNAYRITEQKRLADLSTGFLILSAGMLGRVIGTLYFFVLQNEGATGSSTLIVIVTIAYGMMRIMAYVIFAISTRHIRAEKAPSITTLLALPFLLDPSLEMVAILVLIVVVLQSLMNYLSGRSSVALYVFIAFLLILASHIAPVVAVNTIWGYLFSQILQFLGFTALLLMLVRTGRNT